MTGVFSRIRNMLADAQASATPKGAVDALQDEAARIRAEWNKTPVGPCEFVESDTGGRPIQNSIYPLRPGQTVPVTVGAGGFGQSVTAQAAQKQQALNQLYAQQLQNAQQYAQNQQAHLAAHQQYVATSYIGGGAGAGIMIATGGGGGAGGFGQGYYEAPPPKFDPYWRAEYERALREETLARMVTET